MVRHLAVLLLGSVIMTSWARAGISHLDCIQTGPGQYRISFQLEQGSSSVKVFSSLKPDGSDGVLVGTATHSPYDVQAGGAAQRAYFLLQPDQGEARWISLRHLPLEGAPNFRDLGGYQTVDSKQLRWGILYRSGELGHLTDADQVYMRSLNLQSLVDFRTSRERTRLPDRWPENVVGSDADKRLYAPIGDEPGNDTQKLIQEAFLYHAPPERLRALMTLAYEGFALQGASTYGQAFRQIIDGKVPMVYHCTAGKDRAGLFSAILLAILGVPQETIRYDYMLSNEYLLAPEALRQMTQAISSAAPDAPPPSRESVAVMAGVDEAYLTASFAAIDRRYGSFDAYRREALGLSVQDVRKLREILLMP